MPLLLLVGLQLSITGLSTNGEPCPDVVHLEPEWEITVDALVGFPAASDTSVTDLEPGVPPEGDYLMDMAYTPDGQHLLVCNYMSQTLTAVDPLSMEVDTTLALEGRPGGIACSGDYAVIAFPFSDRVAVISLFDWSVAAGFDTGEQPWVVRVSPDGSEAYVSCDVDDVCHVIDLDALSLRLTIDNFPVWLASYGYGSESNRYYVKFSDMRPLPGSDLLAVGDGESSVLVFDTFDGSLVHTVSVPDCSSLSLSGDGQYLVALSASNPLALSRIELSGYTVDATVDVTGYSSGMARQIAVNQDGSKAFVSTSSNTTTLVRLELGDFKTFASTYSAFWIGVSPDHSLAVSGQYRFSIIDFASEQIVAQHQGNSQYVGCVSPVAQQAGGYDPTRNEAVYVYTFDDTSVTYHGEVVSGSPVEGDGCRRVAIAPDGSVAVVSNTLSDNASFVDVSTMEVVAILDMGDRVQDAAITPDSRYAVVCGFNSNSVKVVDLDTYSIVADVPTGSRAGVVSIEPDGSHAWVGNISANTVSVVELDGASSTEIAELAVGTIGVSWAACGISSDVEVSPDGSVCLVAASFDDQVHVVDTSTHSIVATLDVGDFPLQLAFTDDGSRALCTNYSGDTFSLLDVDGASSSVVGTWSAGDGPLRAAYDPLADRLAMGLYGDGQIRMVDPSTGTITDTYDYSAAVVDLAFGQNGSRFALTAPSGSSTPCRLHRDGESWDLCASAVHFDYSDEADLAMAASPGPDWAMVLDWSPQGVEHWAAGSGGMPGLAISPNPGAETLAFRMSLPRACRARLMVFDLGGRLVEVLLEEEMSAGSSTIQWNPGPGVPAGVYCARLEAGGRVRGRLLTLLR